MNNAQRAALVLVLLGLAAAGLWWGLAPAGADRHSNAGSLARAGAADASGAAEPAAATDADADAAAELRRVAAPAAAADPAAPGASVQALLLDPQGRPAAGAELSAAAAAGTAPGASLRAPAAGDGVARLGGLEPERAFSFSAGGDHWQSLTIPDPGPLRAGDALDLGAWTLTPGSCIRGRVLTAEGAACGAAAVWLERRDGLLRESEQDRAAARAQTLPDGSFLLPGLPRGLYRLCASADGLGQAVLDGLQVSGAPADLPVELRLTAGQPLAGRVREAAGAPLPEARVLLWHPRAGEEEALPAAEEILARGVPVAADGSFTVPGWSPEPARALLLAHAPGFSVEQIDPARVAAPLDFLLEPRARLRGQVFSSGRPEPGAELRLRPPGPGEWNAVADAEGRFEFAQIPPGLHQLWAASAAGSCEILPLEVFAGMPELRLDVIGGPGLAVLVSDASGAPLPGATVRLEPDDLWTRGFEGDWEWSPADFESEAAAPAPAPAAAAAADAVAQPEGVRRRPERVVLLGRSAVTDAQGRARFADLPQGVWQIVAERPGYLPGEETADLDVREAREIPVALQPAGALRALLLDENAEPVPGARLLLQSRPRVNGEEEGLVTRPRITDAQGVAWWRELPADEYSLSLDPAAPARGAFGSAAGERSGEAPAAFVQAAQRAVLAPGATQELRMTIRGLAIPTVLVTQGGAPAAQARIELIPGTLSAAEALALRFGAVSGAAAVADGAGRARLPAIAPGAYTLVVQPAGAAPASATTVQLRAGVQTLEVELPSGSLRGRVLGAGGALAGASVFLMPLAEQRELPELDRQSTPGEEVALPTRAAELAAAQSGAGCMTLTDADGRYEFLGLPAGEYRVQVHAPPYRLHEVPLITHDGAAAVELEECRLEGAGALRGRVTGLEAGSWLRLEAELGAAAAVRLEAGGSFLCDRLEPGRWRLAAAAAGLTLQSSAVEVLADRLHEFDWTAR